MPEDPVAAILRSALQLEDDYALGVIAFQFGTGKFPPEKAQARAALYEHTKCPARLRQWIEALLCFEN